jgi:hypothetical protein
MVLTHAILILELVRFLDQLLPMEPLAMMEMFALKRILVRVEYVLDLIQYCALPMISVMMPSATQGLLTLFEMLNFVKQWNLLRTSKNQWCRV